MITNLNISVEIWKGIAGNFCSDKWELENDWNKINVVERIGSESSEGEVYRIEVNGKEFAGKIMPILSERSFEKNENEISISKELSDHSYFPKVYAGGFCSKTKYNEKSLFYEESYKYFLFEKVCENMSRSEKIRMKHKYKNSSAKELEEIFKVKVNISSHVLISEIVFSDLRQVSKYYYLNEKTWINIILQVLEGIQYLNEERAILHGDLHCGNVLIKIDKNSSSALIHDFGKSERCSFSNSEQRITDSQKFIYDLTLQPDVPLYLKQKLEKILKFISDFENFKTSYPIMNEIINFSENILKTIKENSPL